MEFSAKTRAEIDKLYKGRHHVELSIGILKDGEITCSHWNPDREADDQLLVYPVGSICKPFTASLLAKYVSEGKLDLHAPISWHTGAAGAFNAFLGLNRETGSAVAVAVNYGLVNAEQIGFSILKNDL